MKFTITEEDKKYITSLYNKILSEEQSGVIIKPKEGDNVNVLVSTTNRELSNYEDYLNSINNFIKSNKNKSESLNCNGQPTNESYVIKEGIKIKPKTGLEHCEPGQCEPSLVANSISTFYSLLRDVAEYGEKILPHLEKTDWCKNEGYQK
jgi:hypothetical protein